MATHTPLGEPEKLILNTIHGWLDEQGLEHGNYHEVRGTQTAIDGEYDLSKLATQIVIDFRARMEAESPRGRHSEHHCTGEAPTSAHRPYTVNTGHWIIEPEHGAPTEVNSPTEPQTAKYPPVLGRGLLEKHSDRGMTGRSVSSSCWLGYHFECPGTQQRAGTLVACVCSCHG